MSEVEPVSRQAMYVHCPTCNRTWMAIKLPCELGKSCKLMATVFCANCHEKKQLVVASEEQIAATQLH